MPKIVTTHVVRSDQVAHYLRPRDDVVIERGDGEHEFALVSGPFDRYHRSVTLGRSARPRRRTSLTTWWR